MNGSLKYDFDHIRNNIENELKNENMHLKLYTSIDCIARIIHSIIETNGEGWIQKVVDNDGNSLLNDSEKEQFKTVFQPHIESIVDFFSKKVSGGAGKEQEEMEEVEEGKEGNLFETIMKYINTIDTYVKTTAEQKGILKYEKEYDEAEDIQPFSLLQPASNLVFAIMHEIKIAPRSIVYLIYLALDVARMSITLSGNITGRKIMTIVVSLFELLRGDWKKAVITMMSYYNENNVIFGQLLKVYLTLFRMIDPKIQDSIIYGSYTTIFSMIRGILLSIVPILPYDIRKGYIDVFKEIHKIYEKDKILIEKYNYNIREEYYDISLHDINNIQSIVSDPLFVCSNEFKTSLNSIIGKSHIMDFILLFIGLPNSEKSIKEFCEKKIKDHE